MARFNVWWIPQIPMEPFNVEVPDLDTAILMCDTLAQYDLFQYHNNVKPDYSNTGGITVTFDDGDEEETDWEDEDTLNYIREKLDA